MKFLLVLALALVAASAEEKKEMKLPILPYAYAANYYHAPSVYNYQAPAFYNYQAPAFYNYQPVQIKPVAKEVEVQVKKVEFVEPEGLCKNSQGFPVPCHKAKRSAEEEMEEKKPIVPMVYNYNALPYATHFPYYNNYFNTYPLAYNFPVYHTAAGCQNYLGQAVACNMAKRSADEEEMMPEMKEMEEKKKAILPITYGLPYYNNFASYPLTYNTLPYFNNYASYPLTYNTLPYYNNYYTTTYAHTFAKRSAEEEMEEEKKAAVLPLTYGLPWAYNAFPYTYNYAAYAAPVAYKAAEPIVYKAPEPIVQEVEYIKPVYKEVVEKVQLKAACRNAFGWPVPCAKTE